MSNIHQIDIQYSNFLKNHFGRFLAKVAMPSWRASTRHGGRAKPGNAPLACQRSTGGGRSKPGNAPLAGKRSTWGSCQAQRCPLEGSAQ